MHYSILESVTEDPHRFYPHFMLEEENEWFVPFVRTRLDEVLEKYRWHPFKKRDEVTGHFKEMSFNTLEQAQEFISRERQKLPVIHYIK